MNLGAALVTVKDAALRFLRKGVLFINGFLFLPYFLVGKIAGEWIRAILLGEKYRHVSLRMRIHAYCWRHGI